MTWGHEQNGVPIAGGCRKPCCSRMDCAQQARPQEARNQGLDGEVSEQIAGRCWPDTCPSWSNPCRRVPGTRGAADRGNQLHVLAPWGRQDLKPGGYVLKPARTMPRRSHRPTAGRACWKPAPCQRPPLGAEAQGDWEDPKHLPGPNGPLTSTSGTKNEHLTP